MFFKANHKEFLCEYTGNFSLISVMVQEKSKPIFLNPYQSTADFFKRMAVVLAAPIAFSLLAIDLLLDALHGTVLVLRDLITRDTDNGRSLLGAVGAVVMASFYLFAAVLSPIFNLSDLIGVGIGSPRKKEEVLKSGGSDTCLTR